jgi:hypothetical protein
MVLEAWKSKSMVLVSAQLLQGLVEWHMGTCEREETKVAESLLTTCCHANYPALEGATLLPS